MRERRERGSLWGVQRRKDTEGGEDGAHDSDASPKAQHLLDLQRSAGNSAVSGAVAQRSLWGDVEEWFGGGGSDSALKANDTPGGIKGGGAEPGAIKGGGQQPVIFESPGSIKGGGTSPGSIKGGGMTPVLDGPAEAGSGGMQGAKGFGDIEEKAALEQKGGSYEQPMGEKGFGGEYEQKAAYEEKGGGFGFDDELPMSEKGSGDYEQKGDTGAYGGGEQTDAEKGYADREEKGGYEGWGDDYGPAPANDEQEPKGGEVYIN